MECGAQDAVCQLTTWLTENDQAAGWLVDLIAKAGANANGLVGAFAEFARTYGQSIVGVIGLSFGFWRWWRYREHILHKRLAEYLRESDTRLIDGTHELLAAIQRPAPGQKVSDPLFINQDLRTVLHERNWDNTYFALGVNSKSPSRAPIHVWKYSSC